jgi:hypothetical protein
MLSPASSSTTEFRIADPFDAAVLWHIFLYCDSCGKDHDSVEDQGSSVTQSLPSYHATAQNAKDAGWYISDRHGETASWDILCPTCAAKQGRHLADRGIGATSCEMVRAFYQALTGRTE